MNPNFSTEEKAQQSLVWQGSVSNYSKVQKDFNDALNKHREASARIKEIDCFLDLANDAYMTEIIPEIEKQKELEKQQTEMMSEIYLEDLVKLSKYEKNNFRTLLLEKCAEGMEKNEDRAFYFAIFLKLETTSERNYRLGLKQKSEKQIKQQFGVDIDLDELNKTDFANDEEREQHKAKFKDFFEKYHQHQVQFDDDSFGDFFKQRERKKTKAQLEREKKLEEAEKLLSTDINKLFKELAKLIHPDREQEPVMREKKETLMKELSNARDNTNIAEILRIKMLVDELIPNNQTSISFNDSSIKRFISVIKTKIKELEDTISRKLYQHPLFEDFNTRAITKESVKRHISKEIKYTKKVTTNIEEIIASFVDNPKNIKNYIKIYITQQQRAWLDF